MASCQVSGGSEIVLLSDVRPAIGSPSEPLPKGPAKSPARCGMLQTPPCRDEQREDRPGSGGDPVGIQPSEAISHTPQCCWIIVVKEQKFRFPFAPSIPQRERILAVTRVLRKPIPVLSNSRSDTISKRNPHGRHILQIEIPQGCLHTPSFHKPLDSLDIDTFSEPAHLLLSWFPSAD
jgi:hypothetical protein